MLRSAAETEGSCGALVPAAVTSTCPAMFAATCSARSLSMANSGSPLAATNTSACDAPRPSVSRRVARSGAPRSAPMSTVFMAAGGGGVLLGGSAQRFAWLGTYASVCACACMLACSQLVDLFNVVFLTTGTRSCFALISGGLTFNDLPLTSDRCCVSRSFRRPAPSLIDVAPGNRPDTSYISQLACSLCHAPPRLHLYASRSCSLRPRAHRLAFYFPLHNRPGTDTDAN